jgi:RHS repeat-associated protein
VLGQTAQGQQLGTLHYVNDPNGCPTRLIDSKGQVLWAASYSAWGAVDKLHASAVSNPIRLQGQYEDGETGLYYNRHRYYDSIIGAFTSEDPLGLQAGTNNYGFGPNTISWIDPLGLTCKNVSKGNAAADLPKLRGKSIPHVEKDLRKSGFSKVKDNGINQTWKHADGSEVRVHKYGNQKPSGHKSGNNAHVHKQDPAKNQLNDQGKITTDPNESHIGVKNPKDLPIVRGRPHGDGSK